MPSKNVPVSLYAIQVSSREVRLHWYSPGDVSIYAYRIERKIEEGEWELLRPEVRALGFSDSRVRNIGTYFYRVSSLSIRTGQSPWSECSLEVILSPISLSSPPEGSLTQSGMVNNLYWNSGEVTIERRFGPNDFRYLATSENSYSDSSTVPGIGYTYRIKFADSDWSVLTAPIMPTLPEVLTLETNGRVISWIPSKSKLPIIHYQYRYADLIKNLGEWMVTDFLEVELDLQPNVRYYVEVRAVSEAGSSPSVSTDVVIIPSSPTDLSDITNNIDSNRIIVTWNPPAEWNDYSGRRRYLVYVNDESHVVYHPFLIMPLVYSTSYYVQIFAVNGNGLRSNVTNYAFETQNLPKAIHSYSVSGSNVHITWDADADWIEYEWKPVTDDSYIRSWTTTAEATLYGMERGVTYSIRYQPHSDLIGQVSEFQFEIPRLPTTSITGLNYRFVEGHYLLVFCDLVTDRNYTFRVGPQEHTIKESSILIPLNSLSFPVHVVVSVSGFVDASIFVDADTTVPEVPSEVVISEDAGVLSIVWNHPEEEDYYTTEIKLTAHDGEVRSVHTDSGYSFNFLSNHWWHYDSVILELVHIDSFGNRSPSYVEKYELQTSDYPAPPTRMNVKPGDSSLTVSWGYTLDSDAYMIGLFLDNELLELPTTFHSHTFSGLNNYQTYSISMVLQNNAGKSQLVSISSAPIPVPFIIPETIVTFSIDVVWLYEVPTIASISDQDYVVNGTRFTFTGLSDLQRRIDFRSNDGECTILLDSEGRFSVIGQDFLGITTVYRTMEFYRHYHWQETGALALEINLPDSTLHQTIHSGYNLHLRPGIKYRNLLRIPFGQDLGPSTVDSFPVSALSLPLRLLRLSSEDGRIIISWALRRRDRYIKILISGTNYTSDSEVLGNQFMSEKLIPGTYSVVIQPVSAVNYEYLLYQREAIVVL